jgi:sulfatase maturation enzyme AslB (radical SAM superfamily)
MYHNAQIAHWLQNQDKKKFIPVQADIDMTNKCNQDCYYCISAEFREKEKVQQHYTKYITLIDRLNTWREHTPNSYGSLHAITFPGGGEPTLLKGYEKVIEHAIDCGFFTSLTTNGTLLERLYESVSAEKLKKMNWIGIDIDAADEETYERIRRSKTKNMFDRVVKNATELIKTGANVDFKLLADENNTSDEQIENMFKLGKQVGIRMIYYRPVIFEHMQSYAGGEAIFNITPHMISKMVEYSKKYQVPYKVNLTKNESRNYSKCHQMFQFPSFAANGKIYSCCDHKGDSNFEIGDWMDIDFRDEWLGEKHKEVYNNINTHLCPPCRPNKNNIEIQKCLDDPSKLSILNS